MKNSFLILMSLAELAKGASSLSLPNESSSLETLKESVSGILPLEGKLLVFTEKSQFYSEGPWHSSGLTRAERFGSLAAWKRVPVAELGSKGVFVGGVSTKKGLVLIDGGELYSYRLDQDGKVLRKGGIVWDRILPIRDRIGEAPKFEISQLRHNFLKEISNASDKFRSVAFVKEDDKDYSFYALTGSSHVPLVKFICSIENPAYCEVTRECKIPKIAGSSLDLHGLAYDQKNDQLVVGNSSKNMLFIFKPGDCGGGQSASSIKLDLKFKPISSLNIDSNSNLWLGTKKRDDYLNASVYLFEKWR
jgi:hypothetical protein